MSKRLSIAVADDEPIMLEFLTDALTRLGHQVVVAVETGRKLVEACHRHKPDLIITDIKMPDMDGLEASVQISKDLPVPVIVVSAHHDEEFIDRARQDHVLAYLIKPIKEVDLAPAIALAMQRFGELKALQHEADDLRQALEDRKVIERAKGILMTQAGISEEQAFRRLQKTASSQRKRLVEIAQMIVVTAIALDPSPEE